MEEVTISESHDAAAHEAELALFDSRYSPTRLSDALSGRLSPPPWLFASPDSDDGLLRSRTLTMVSAEPFTGKTMLMLALLLGLSAEQPILGYHPLRAQRTLFLGQDAPTWDYLGQLSKLHVGLSQPSIPNPSLLFINRGFSLQDNRFSAFITDLVRIHGITILMIDTLLSFHSAPENDNTEMKKVMDLLKSLRDTLNLSILFSHHTSKMPGISGNYSARGASVISGSVDFHLSLTTRGSVINLNLPKRRGSQKRNASGFLISDSRGGIVLESRTLPASVKLLVLSFLTTDRSEPELLSFLSTQFGDTDPSVTRGRLHGALGVIRRDRTVRLLETGEGDSRRYRAIPSLSLHKGDPNGNRNS